MPVSPHDIPEDTIGFWLFEANPIFKSIFEIPLITKLSDDVAIVDGTINV
jgi:hypothetical protein